MGKPEAITDDTFPDFIQAHDLVVVDAWAPWCGPCKRLEPIVDELATELEGTVTFGKLNTDDNPDTARRFGIMSIPTLLVFKGGDRVDQVVGVVPKDDLKERLLKHAE